MAKGHQVSSTDCHNAPGQTSCWEVVSQHKANSLSLSGLFVAFLLPPRFMVLSRPGLLLRTIPRSKALQQPGSMLMFVAHIATKGHAEAHRLYWHLRPCWCLRVIQPSDSVAAQAHCDILTWTIAKSHVWVHDHKAAKVCVDVRSYCFQWRPVECPEVMVVFVAMQMLVQSYLSHLELSTGAWSHPGLGCWQGPCLGLCWYPWVHGVTKSYMDVWSVDHHLGPC